jgi:hypothetical protein
MGKVLRFPTVSQNLAEDLPSVCQGSDFGALVQREAFRYCRSEFRRHQDLPEVAPQDRVAVAEE